MNKVQSPPAVQIIVRCSRDPRPTSSTDKGKEGIDELTYTFQESNRRTLCLWGISLFHGKHVPVPASRVIRCNWTRKPLSEMKRCGARHWIQVSTTEAITFQSSPLQQKRDLMQLASTANLAAVSIVVASSQDWIGSVEQHAWFRATSTEAGGMCRRDPAKLAVQADGVRIIASAGVGDWTFLK